MEGVRRGWCKMARTKKHAFALASSSTAGSDELALKLGELGFEGTDVVSGGLVLLGASHLGKKIGEN